MVGQKFNRLTAIKRVGLPGERKEVRWLFRCECGTEKEIMGEPVRLGKTRSCGCLRRDMGTWNKSISGPLSHCFQGCGEVPKTYFSEWQYKAVQREIPWTVSIEFLAELFEKQGHRCAISGIPIVMPNSRVPYVNCASLDRIDSNIGYHADNVQWLDRRVNFMKQRMNDAEFIAMCRIIAKNNL